jgi:hypothetical protein
MKYNFLFKPIFFIISLLAATYVVLYVEKLRPSDLSSLEGLFMKEDEIVKREDYNIKPPAGELTQEELQFARIAWKYFENNYHKETGLVNSTDKCLDFNLKDLTAYLMGMLSAHEIGIVDSNEVMERIEKLMFTLEHIELYDEKLPNEKYHTVSLKMLNEQGEPDTQGVGWSAMDVSRFFAFVNKVKFDYPQIFPRLRRVIRRWKMEEVVMAGELRGMVFNTLKNKYVLTFPGRLGYEEYSGKNLMISGYDAAQALSYRDFLKFVNIYGEQIAVDARESRKEFSYNFITSDPYILDGLEYGWDVNSKELSYRIFLAQKQRYLKTGILTAVGEDHTDDTGSGYVYNSVYANFKSWVCYDSKGNKRNDLKMLSTKTAFAWHVLYDDEYSDKLYEEVKKWNNPGRGWYAGRYEKNGKMNKTISAATNGIVLEALNYKKSGKLIKF